MNKMNEEKQIAEKLFASACEKASVCPDASERCKQPIPYDPNMRCIPARRYLDCFSWKNLLGMEFLKDLGVYHLQFCPFCGRNLEEELKRNLAER